MDEDVNYFRMIVRAFDFFWFTRLWYSGMKCFGMFFAGSSVSPSGRYWYYLIP